MYKNNNFPSIKGLLHARPQAWATVRSAENRGSLTGNVRFYQNPYGVLVIAEIHGLPQKTGPCDSAIFGFHIHEGESCTGNASDPFADTRMHYNPYNCPHPYHSGDMPPLFAANGHAFSAFLTDRFSINEIIGKTVVIHDSPDDFSTQPSGNSGSKLACGQIIGKRI